ncbi:MAG: cytochrome P450 [Mycobacterium sp.]
MASIIAMDDPRHGRQRKLVQSAFSARAINRLTESVSVLADQIVDELRELGSFDSVAAVGANLPLQVICDLLDIPATDRPRMRELINSILGVNDPDFGGPQESLQSLLELFGYAIDLGKQRLTNPGDDITRTALTWAVKLLTDHPDQKRSLGERFGELHGNAIDEILRWCSPALHMRRTATTDTEVAGQRIAKGDKVVLWYLAANHDPAVFDRPDDFDINRRNARDQIAFGAGGPHFCLGANLAKMEMRVVLGTLLRSFPDLHATAEPDLLISPFVHTIKTLPCAIG